MGAWEEVGVGLEEALRRGGRQHDVAPQQLLLLVQRLQGGDGGKGGQAGREGEVVARLPGRHPQVARHVLVIAPVPLLQQRGAVRRAGASAPRDLTLCGYCGLVRHQQTNESNPPFPPRTAHIVAEQDCRFGAGCGAGWAGWSAGAESGSQDLDIIRAIMRWLDQTD